MMYVIIGVIVMVSFYIVSIYNRFIKLRNSVDESFSTMDVYMKKRYDLIPNLVETVKGYAKHEQETLEKVIQARNKAMASDNINEKQANANMLAGTLKSLFALSESYPELKADTQFLDLQKQLQKVEEDIANARKYYNAVVKTFNTMVESFPSNVIAGIFNFEKYPFFIIEATQRENIKVSF